MNKEFNTESNAVFIEPVIKTSNTLVDAVNILNTAVSSTMGPGGKYVIIDSHGPVPHVTKDGVTVSESIHSDDPVIEMILKLLKEAARKTNREVGDGTTTTTSLTAELILAATDLISEGANIRNVIEGMERASDMAQSYIEQSVQKVSRDDSEIIKAVANISSNGDASVVKLVEEAVRLAGEHGTINVVETLGGMSGVESTEGAHMTTAVKVRPNPNERFTAGANPGILLIEGDLPKQHEIGAILKLGQELKQRKRPLIVIAKEFGEGVTKLININNTKGAFNIILAEAEGFDNSRIELLEDLAVLFNTEIISTNGTTSKALRDLSTSSLFSIMGSCKSFEASNKEIIYSISEDIYESESSQRVLKSIVSKMEELDTSGVSVLTDAGRRQLDRRMEKFSSIATINVGGITQGEISEKKYRVDDAVSAVASAVNHGILPGGGFIWINLNRILNTLETDKADSIGVTVFSSACKSVFTRLLANAGYDTSKADDYKDLSTMDIVSGEFVNAFDKGIVDPAAVTIEAIFNSIAVAKVLLNTQTFITNGSEI